MPIKVKDHAKCKAWEQRRRDKLNDAFNNLSQLLPHYDPAKILAKVEILEKSTEFVKELRLSNSRLLSSQAETDEKCRLINELQDEVNRLILRVKQLTLLLKKAKITIPVGPEIKTLGAKQLKWSGKLKPNGEENCVLPVSYTPVPDLSTVLRIDANNGAKDAVEKDNIVPITTSPSSNTSEIPIVLPSQPKGDTLPTINKESERPSTPATSVPSIIIPLKEVNTSKPSISPPPNTIKAFVSPHKTLENSTTITTISSENTIAIAPTLSSPLKLVSSTEPIFSTGTTATPIQLPLQTFIIAPCPFTGTNASLPGQNQLFTGISLQAPLLQKIPIKPMLKPVPRVIKRRNRKTKKQKLQELEDLAKAKKLLDTDPINLTETNDKIQTKTQHGAIAENTTEVSEDTLEEMDVESTVKEKEIITISLDTEPIDKEQTASTKVTEKEKEEPTSSSFNAKKSEIASDTVVEKEIPVLRIIESTRENDKNENDDILSRVVVSEDKIFPEKENDKEQGAVTCITLDDEKEPPKDTEPELPAHKESESVQTEKDVEPLKDVELDKTTQMDPEAHAPKTPPNTTEQEIEEMDVACPLPNVAPQNSEIVQENSEGTYIQDMEIQEILGENSEKGVTLDNQSLTIITEESLSKEATIRRAEENVVVVESNDFTTESVATVGSNEPILINPPMEPCVKPVVSESEAEATVDSQPQPMEVTEVAELPQPNVEILPCSSSSVPSTSKEPSKPSTSLQTPQKQKPAAADNHCDNVTTTEKISECIARSIDLIDATSPTQVFLNMFPLLPRESSAIEHQPPLPSFFIDAMLPEADNNSSGSVPNENLELIPSSSSSHNSTSCLALTPSQYSTATSIQQPSSPFSFSNNYYWTPTATTSNFESSLDYRPSSSLQGTGSHSSTSIFSSLPVSTPSYTPLPPPQTTKAINPIKSTATAQSQSNTTVSTAKSPIISVSYSSATTLSSRTNKTSKSIPSVPATATITTTATVAVPKPISSFGLETSSSFLSSSKSNKSGHSHGISAITSEVITTTNSTTTNVTWSLTTPSQSSSISHSHHHHPQHHHNHNQPQPCSQITSTQFPASSSSTCSLFDALTPMDASFFRPLMNALETNDFRGLEFPPHPPLIAPPTKSLYSQKNASLGLNTSTINQSEMPLQPVPLSIFERNPSQTHLNTEKSRKQKEQTTSLPMGTKQSHHGEPSSSKTSSSTKSPGKASKSASKQKPENSSKQSPRAGKSSRTQPYVIPSTPSSSTLDVAPPPPQKQLLTDFPSSYPISRNKSSSSNSTEFQAQNLFMPNPNVASIFTPPDYNRMPNPAHIHSIQPAPETRKQPSSKSAGAGSSQAQPVGKSPRIKEDKSPSRSSKGRVSGQSTASAVMVQSQPTTSTSHHHPPGQNQSLHTVQHSANTSHPKSQTKTHVPPPTLSQSIPQDLQFHHPESFQLFSEFHPPASHAPGNQPHHHQEQQASSTNYQIPPHHHHHPYYLPEITPHFETFPSHVTPSHQHTLSAPTFPTPSQTPHHHQSQYNILTHVPVPSARSSSTTTGSTAQQLNRGKSIHNSNSTNNSIINVSHASTTPANFNSNQRSQQPSYVPPAPQFPVTHQGNPPSNSFPYNIQTPQGQQHHSRNIPQSNVPQSQQRHDHHTASQQHSQPSGQNVNVQQRPVQRSSASSSSKSKLPQQTDTVQSQSQSQVSFQTNQHTQHQLQIQSHHNSSHIQAPPQSHQTQNKPQSTQQQINRPLASRTVNWMTDTAYRGGTAASSTGGSTSSVHPMPHKQQQPRQQNNPFSVSKLVGSTSAKSQNQPNSTNNSSNNGEIVTKPKSASKSTQNNSNANTSIGHQSQNQSNYCAEALIRKDPSTAVTDWNEFSFPHYSHPNQQHSHSQSHQPNNNSTLSSDFGNCHSQYHHYHENAHSSGHFTQSDNSANVQHFHHPTTQHLHPPGSGFQSSQPHHNPQHSHQAEEMHYQNAPNPMHFQSSSQPHHGQHHSYHQQPHHSHHSSSTSSVSNFNLSSIFPEINDKRNNNAGSVNTSQNPGQSGTGSSGQPTTGSARIGSSSRVSGGNMCNFQHHPGFNTSSGNSGNNLHH